MNKECKAGLRRKLELFGKRSMQQLWTITEAHKGTNNSTRVPFAECYIKKEAPKEGGKEGLSHHIQRSRGQE